MTVYAIDFETTYNKGRDISTLGVKPYLQHPDTKIYLVSIVGSDGFEFVGKPAEAPWDAIHEGEWVSHNRSFDSACFVELMRQGTVLRVWPRAWHCTADLMSFLNYPRALAQGIEAVTGRKPDKDIRAEMRGQTEHSMQLNRTFWADVLAYSLNDSRLCLWLWQTYGHLMPDTERWLSAHTSGMGHDGVPVREEFLEEAIRTLRLEKMNLAREIPWWWDAEDDTGVLSREALVAECLKNGVPPPKSTAKSSEEFDEWLMEWAERVPFIAPLAKYRSIYRSLGLLQRIERSTIDGVLPYSLKYFGAHTGRWSGDSGLNLQNLSNAPVCGVKIRNVIGGIPMISADFAQIEPRVLCWIIGDHAQLELMRRGNAYEAHARATMGYSDPRPLKEFDMNLYKLAKARVLALGYGCGAPRFISMARSQAGLELTLPESQKGVDSFRSSNPKVIGLWDRLDNAFRHSVGEDFCMNLPSGRALGYRDVMKVREGASKFGKAQVKGRTQGRWRYAYGGLLTENLIQAVARDILGEAVMRLERAGASVMLHIHDEVLIDARNGVTVEDVTRIMTIPPVWAEGLPLAVEAAHVTQYDK